MSCSTAHVKLTIATAPPIRDLRKPDFGEAIWARFSQPKEQTLWYYRSLANRFCERLPGQLSNELREIVEVLEAGG
jgi:hypothetical protein